jgi:hypothetical protein
MKTINEVNQAIMFGQFTNDELNTISNAIKFARHQLISENKRSLRIGQNVAFNSVKLGKRVQGDVTKIAQKYVTVRTNAGLWKVPANMLESA